MRIVQAVFGVLSRCTKFPESRSFVFNLFPGFNCIIAALKSRIIARKSRTKLMLKFVRDISTKMIESAPDRNLEQRGLSELFALGRSAVLVEPARGARSREGNRREVEFESRLRRPLTVAQELGCYPRYPRCEGATTQNPPQFGKLGDFADS